MFHVANGILSFQATLNNNINPKRYNNLFRSGFAKICKFFPMKRIQYKNGNFPVGYFEIRSLNSPMISLSDVQLYLLYYISKTFLEYFLDLYLYLIMFRVIVEASEESIFLAHCAFCSNTEVEFGTLMF